MITLEDIQLVHFERVQFQLKNFDMVFIFKDYNKKVMMVTAVPMTMLDHVKVVELNLIFFLEIFFKIRYQNNLGSIIFM